MTNVDTQYHLVIRGFNQQISSLQVAEIGRVFGSVKQAHADIKSLSATISFSNDSAALRCQQFLTGDLEYDTEVVAVTQDHDLKGDNAPDPPKIWNQTNLVIQHFPLNIVTDIPRTFEECGELHSYEFLPSVQESMRYGGTVGTLKLVWKTHKSALMCQTVWNPHCVLKWDNDPMSEARIAATDASAMKAWYEFPAPFGITDTDAAQD